MLKTPSKRAQAIFPNLQLRGQLVKPRWLFLTHLRGSDIGFLPTREHLWTLAWRSRSKSDLTHPTGSLVYFEGFPGPRCPDQSPARPHESPSAGHIAGSHPGFSLRRFFWRFLFGGIYFFKTTLFFFLKKKYIYSLNFWLLGPRSWWVFFIFLRFLPSSKGQGAFWIPHLWGRFEAKCGGSFFREGFFGKKWS